MFTSHAGFPVKGVRREGGRIIHLLVIIGPSTVGPWVEEIFYWIFGWVKKRQVMRDHGEMGLTGGQPEDLRGPTSSGNLKDEAP